MKIKWKRITKRLNMKQTSDIKPQEIYRSLVLPFHFPFNTAFPFHSISLSHGLRPNGMESLSYLLVSNSFHSLFH